MGKQVKVNKNWNLCV